MNIKILSRFTLLGVIMMAGCDYRTQPVDTAAIIETIEKDQTVIYKEPTEEESALTLEEALARALKYNLDTKVAEMDELIAADDVNLQMLNSLPSVTAKTQYQGRNNEGGSSSFSVLTGMQSLAPSISQEQHRAVVQLTTEWNLLDAGINVWRGRNANDQMLIAQERRRKVYHSVIQDTYIAFWRAAVAQSAIPMIDPLLLDIEEQINKIDQQIELGVVPLGDAQSKKADLLERKMQLARLKNNLSLADLELKTLTAYPLMSPLKLDLQEADPFKTNDLPLLDNNIEAYEQKALLNRPEIREEMLNKRISTRDIKLSILESIPGIELLLTYNYDSNEFLVFNNWVDGIAGLTSSINKIVTAPRRHDRAQNVDLLADKRRQALIAAIFTQVHVAKARHDALSSEYQSFLKGFKLKEDILKRAKDFNDNGLMSKAELLNVRIDSQIAEINKAIAYTDVHDSYGRFINTLGIDIWDDKNPNYSVQDYAQQIQKNLGNFKIASATSSTIEREE